MRRHPVAEGLKQETEALPHFILANPQGRKHLLLDRGVVDPDRPTTELDTIHDHIVRPGADRAGITRQQSDILGQRRGEGVVHGEETTLILIPLEERKVGHPEEVVPAIGNQTTFCSKMKPQGAESGEDDFLSPANHHEQILFGGAGRGEEAQDTILPEGLLRR